MPTANTHDCFTELVGHTIAGVLFDALPMNRSHDTTTTLVLDDGRGFTFNHKLGSYWWDSADDVSAAIRRKRKELERMTRELVGVLELAGEGA